MRVRRGLGVTFIQKLKKQDSIEAIDPLLSFFSLQRLMSAPSLRSGLGQSPTICQRKHKTFN